MAVSIRTSEHHDTLKARGQRRAIVRRSIALGAAVLALAVPGWVVLGSSFLAVDSVHVEGNMTIAAGAIETVARAEGNMVLLKQQHLAARITEAFPVLSHVEVKKDYPRSLRITVAERAPIGLWCRGETCRYVDGTGAFWGNAARSRGAILLLIDDERTSSASDDRFTKSIEATAKGLPEIGLRAQWLTIPKGVPGQITIHADAGYDVYLDAFGDTADQLATLTVFLADRAKDPAFKPKYIDLRTPGRVYFK